MGPCLMLHADAAQASRLELTSRPRARYQFLHSLRALLCCIPACPFSAWKWAIDESSDVLSLCQITLTTRPRGCGEGEKWVTDCFGDMRIVACKAAEERHLFRHAALVHREKSVEAWAAALLTAVVANIQLSGNEVILPKDGLSDIAAVFWVCVVHAFFSMLMPIAAPCIPAEPHHCSESPAVTHAACTCSRLSDNQDHVHHMHSEFHVRIFEILRKVVSPPDMHIEPCMTEHQLLSQSHEQAEDFSSKAVSKSAHAES